MTLRVLALVTDAFGNRGGMAQYNRDLLGALGGQGVSVVILPRIASEPATLPAGVGQLQARAGRASYVAAAMAAALRERPDVVFCGHVFMAPLAALVSRMVGARLVIQMHGIEAWPRPGRLVRAAVEQADMILCVSRHTRAAVLTWASVASERVLVLPNTVDAAFVPGERSVLRDELALDTRRVLLTVGRMHPDERYKGHDRVIAALPALVVRGHDVAYVVAGEGADQPRLAGLAAASGVADRVIFVGGPDPERLRAAYRMADLFVMPSTGEGFGIAFLEAMASGTPALGLADGGARDALGDGSLGTIASGVTLADAIAAALETPVDRAALAGATRARFGRDRFASGASWAFERLLAA